MQDIILTLKSASDRNGKEYNFPAYQLGSCFKKCRGGGIYILIAQDDVLDLWRIVYIGTTDNFNKRIGTDSKSHHKWLSFIKYKATHVVVLVVEDDKLRLKLEKELISFNRTGCNVMHAHIGNLPAVASTNFATFFGVDYVV